MYCLKINPDARYWQKNKELHRNKDLPAIEYFNGSNYYYNNGLRYLFIKHENGTKEYYTIMYRLHKLNGPAVIYPNGDVEYWFYGKRHKENGPAVIIGNKQYWFEFGEFIKCIV